MPEGPETLRSIDKIRNVLCQPNKPAVLNNVMRILTNGNSRYPSVNIGLLINSLQHPIVDVYCKGKAYFLEFYGGVFVYAHHKMGGEWLINPESSKNVHFIFQFIVNNQYINLCYGNERFGDFEIFGSKPNHIIDKIAPGFIGRFVMSEEEWLTRFESFSTSKKNIRNVLMDQNILCSGLGNYLVAEILYYAKLHPQTEMRKITKEWARMLYRVCKWCCENFYTGALNWVVYGRSISPEGYAVQVLMFGTRKHYYVKELQQLL